MLFVPESFKIEEKEEIRARRRAALARVYASRDEMMVVVGEIKEIVPAHGAERIVLRHVGDMPFVMDQDMARRFHKRFAGELAREMALVRVAEIGRDIDQRVPAVDETVGCALDAAAVSIPLLQVV